MTFMFWIVINILAGVGLHAVVRGAHKVIKGKKTK